MQKTSALIAESKNEMELAINRENEIAMEIEDNSNRKLLENNSIYKSESEQFSVDTVQQMMYDLCKTSPESVVSIRKAAGTAVSKDLNAKKGTDSLYSTSIGADHSENNVSTPKNNVFPKNYTER